MKKLYYTLIITSFLIINLNSQSSVAICGWDATGSSTSGDEVSFVLLRDFAAGEVIYITEDEYVSSSGTFNSTEGHLAFTVPAGGLLENDVVSIVESSSGIYTEQCGTGGTVSGSGSWSLAQDALGGMSDEVYAYSATSSATPWSTVTEIHCFVWSATSAPPSSQDPSTDYPNSIVVTYNFMGASGVNADFMDGARVNATIPIFLDGSNWNQSTSAITLSCLDFTNQMLPIELVSFDSRLKGAKVVLGWETASEVNNERFEIEHSTDGKIFTSIGTVDGKGTSNETNSYELVHHTPIIGMNYYRLKQIDYDGTYSYSDVVVENINYNISSTATAYPNPFTRDLTLQFPSSERNYADKTRTIEIYDVYGKLVLSTEVPMDETNTSLDLSVLNSGTYFLQSMDGKYALTNIQRIVKL